MLNTLLQKPDDLKPKKSKTKKHNKYMRTRVLFMVLVLFGLGHVLQVRADDFMQTASNYSAMIMGVDKVQFTLATQYDGSFNEGISEGHVYLIVDGGARQSLFDWRCDNYRELTSDSESGKCYIQAFQSGTFQLTGKVKNGYKTFTSQNGIVSYTLGYNDDNDDHFSTTVTWTVPRSLRGRNLKIVMWAHIEDRDRNWYMPKDNSDKTSFHTLVDWSCPAAPEVSAVLGDPILAFDATHVNNQMFTYSISARSVKWAKLHYTDALTGKTYTQTLPNNLVGTAYIPADRPWKDVHVEAHVIDAEGKEVSENITSDKKTSNMLHYPTGLSASLDSQGNAQLVWGIANAEQEDMLDGDYFEIQRNLSGSDARTDPNWSTVSASVKYEQGKTHYDFKDETLFNQYNGNKVAYRIRRAYTGMWQWADESGFDSYQIPSQFVLPSFATATVNRSETWNDMNHVAEFAFTLNQTGNLIKDEQGRYQLFTANDFKYFAELVNNGQTNLNAIMMKDIDISGLGIMIGNSEANAYKGTFDGNGHILTVNYNTATENTAPISVANGATVKNLHVKGVMVSSRKFIAGVIGRVVGGEATTNVENCRVSATISSSVNGDATNGGIVAVNYATVNIKDCRFDGEFLGENCHSNGGILGWNDGDYSRKGTATLTNCLFAPSLLATKLESCNTFARTRTNSRLTLTNCHYTQLYDKLSMSSTATVNGKEYMIIRSADDWNKFRNAVMNASSSGEVNAILEADISVTTSVGMDAWVYNGTFDGNGHTLEINTDWGGNNFAAPFPTVNKATFKNLHVKGKVRGGIHSSGFVGHTLDKGDVKFENCWVSTTVQCTSTHCGGFFGHGTSATISIVNCRFDGSLSANASGSYAGAFMGWGSGTWIFEHNYENGSYSSVGHSGMNYRGFSSPWGGNATNYSAHPWSEMASAANKNITDQNTALEKLGDGWWLKDGKAVPRIDAVKYINGSDANQEDAQGLVSKLGSQWHIENDVVVPKVPDTDEDVKDTRLTTVWDKRAKLQLRINMHGQNGIESRIVDLSENEDAVTKHQFKQELTRKYVDYSFDLIIRRGNSPMPISGTDADSIVIPIKKTDKPELQDYSFKNSNLITKLEANKKQSSIELVWETSGGDNDYFRVLRRNSGGEAWTDTVARKTDQQYFEDKTVAIQQKYDYCVESIYECEGTNKNEKIVYNAECDSTGRIEGYIRMSDGTAMAGVKVVCENKDNPSETYSTVTDEAGYYVFQGLVYTKVGKYAVRVEQGDDGANFTGPNADGIVNFTTSTNWAQNFNFYMDNYFIYSGNVYYRNTSIPVPGVSFRLDGAEMRDASNNVITTDTQGAFELSIPRGTHSVQAYKDGHRFADNGFLIDRNATGGDPTRYNFIKNVASIYLWDSTLVTLRGRVVGGDIQGYKALGKSLSKNNLGDSLKIVMQLEGDNTSWLIRKQNDETVKTNDYFVTFGEEGKDTTRVNVTRHTMTIRPDSKTGEYQLMVPPVKYKVIEVSAQGYATLFQQGKVGETIDLTFQKDSDVCEYSRIYHSIPTVEVTQFNAKSEPYFGAKTTTATDNIGNNAVVQLWGYNKYDVNVNDSTTVTDSTAVYSFGYPVFMAGSPYGWMLQACEKYYWNNKPTALPDIVNLHGGTVSIKNYLVSTEESNAATNIELDSLGYGSYVFTPANTTNVLTGTDALKSVDITLKYDGNYYDVLPLNGKLMRGYVMATTPKAEGTYTIAANYPRLIDILRDPPGSGSSSYIEAGSKLSYTYSPTFEGTAGVSMTQTDGTSASTYTGAVAITMATGTGTESGLINQAKSDKRFSFTLASTYNGSWTTSYNIDVNERIQTRTGQKWIGGKADIFMGTNEQLVIQDAIAVRAIPEKQYQLMKTHEGGTFQVTSNEGVKTNVKVRVGTMKVLAEGKDVNGEKVYLVRDEVMGVGNRIESTFIHSQYYIEEELLPQLVKLRNSLILPKDSVSAQEAQTIADSKREPVYVSTASLGSPYFGCTDSVKVYYPKEPKGDNINQVKDLNQQMGYWIDMLAQNEMEKLNVQSSNLVKNYDIDGGVGSLQYSENFSASRNKSGFIKWPGLSNANIANLFPSWALGVIKDLATDGHEAYAHGYTDPDGNSGVKVESATATSAFTFKFTPILNFNFQDKSGENKTRSKKIGFTISTASKSSLNVDVYRTRNGQYSINEEDYKDKDGVVYDEMLNMTVDVLDELRYGQPYHPDSDIDVYSNFVFRTRGGATTQPYEGEKRTKWYQPGTVLDVATTPVDKPNIWIEQPVVSNVPFDEPAHFVLHMANESDFPEQATFLMQYFLASTSNPKGAKVCVDGKVLNTTGETVSFYPIVDSKGKHNVITKEITVYPSTSYDYENLAICLYDPEDNSRVYTANFSAHFIPSAGKVNVSVPGNNWVMNTESPYDGKRKGWYMPVRIDGFDVNFPNFDHIELQYKLSNQGDKDWVSTCSYYVSDSLRQRASGVTDTIPSNGIIMAPFYGENDPVEQYYDIRAVNYCRYAGGFLTKSSPILKGIKDTRLPELFGTPEPINGILGIGDDLKITFSEPIAGNYLSKINNFELLGTPKSRDIATSTSLSFDGENSFAYSNGTRNMTGKSFTVDVMLNPATDKRAMTVFSHGDTDKGISFGLSADRYLTATVNGKTYMSDTIVPFNGILREVAYVVEPGTDSIKVHFYDGSKAIGSKAIPGVNENVTVLMIGADIKDDSRYYKGDMLEFRLWNRAMDASSLDAYGKKTLTGYESGLLDYYPMNEGKGSFCYDKAPASMDLNLLATAWKRPNGISLKMDGTTGLRIKPDKFMRSKEHDYTLMFWVRSYDKNATFFSNGEATEAAKAAGKTDQISIGVDGYKLYVRSDGWQKNTDVYMIDGEWHHIALTVSRSRNVANLYLDQKLIDSFPADSLQGISSDHIALGSTYVDKNTQKHQLNGNIDEVAMFSSVLPTNLMNELSTHTPDGKMTSMMAYLNFERSARMDDNSMHLEPTGISLKRYKDNQGNVVARRDTIASLEDFAGMVDRTSYAPMLSTSQLDNLNFSYVANGNELLVNIKEPDYAIEKTNVYLTVKEVPDLQGNLMASPVTANVYVYRNPLRWDKKKVTCDVKYGEGLTMEIKVQNLSGQRQDYELCDLPLWVSASKTNGVIDPLSEETITLTVSPYINVGTYDEQITLVGDNDMAEPLPFVLNVRDDGPMWAVSDNLKKNSSMMVVTRVKINGIIQSDPDDILAAFDDKLQVLGTAHVEVDNKANANEALAYLTIYDSATDDNTKSSKFKLTELNFEFFDASTGKIYTVKSNDMMDSIPFTFRKDTVIGSATSPVVLEDLFSDVQAMKLKKGCNWVSFNVIPSDQTMIQFLDSNTKWEVGDKIVVVNGTKTLKWMCRADTTAARKYRWVGDVLPDDSLFKNMFMIYSKSDKTVYFGGFPNFHRVTVHKDWNRIGYMSTINLPIEQAMSNYLGNASEGDIIKSQDAFAVASRTASGLAWKGSLKYMEHGKGYMLKRHAKSNVTFDYPYFYGENRYSGSASNVRRRAVHTATTMNIVASVSGFDTEQGDVLTVYNGAEKVAEIEADDEQLYYLSIGCNDKAMGTLVFAIERDGEVVATTNSTIRYAADKVFGSPDEPTDISFVALDQMPHDGRWYTLSGILLPKKPVSSGLYIHNGKVVKL